MRVVHLSYNIPRPVFTDPEVWLRRINFSIGVLESMAKYVEIFSIYNIQYKGILTKNKVTYHFPNFNKWQLLIPVKFNRYVKTLSPSVVIVHGLIFPWQVIMLRLQLGRNVMILAQHHAERPLGDIRQFIQMWADRCIKAYLFASFDLGRQWVDRRQIRSIDKIKEIMGTSSPFYSVEKAKAKAAVNVSGDPVFLWVGGLDVNKDPATLVKAFIRFNKSCHGAALYLIYQTNDLLDELKKIISEHHASSYIHLVGRINNPDLLYWYNSADFIVSSSHYEGSGIAVCEGLSCGCIPILTNIPSFRMMTDNGKTGLLYEAGNEDALLSALEKSTKLDREQQKSLVLNYFNQKLSFDANAKSIMDVITENN